MFTVDIHEEGSRFVALTLTFDNAFDLASAIDAISKSKEARNYRYLITRKENEYAVSELRSV